MPTTKQIDVQRGDVYAISTSIGYAFFQCVGTKYEPDIHVIRVLQSVLPSTVDFQASMVHEKERYYLMMVVGAAVRRKLITFVGTFPLPHNVRIPIKYRRLHYVSHKNIRDWYELYQIGKVVIYERRVTKLTDKFLALSCNSIWNDTLLRERIEENWSLKDWK